MKTIAANLLLLTLGFLAAYAFYPAVYNRYFHPLRHFPGPFRASVPTSSSFGSCILNSPTLWV